MAQFAARAEGGDIGMAPHGNRPSHRKAGSLRVHPVRNEKVVPGRIEHPRERPGAFDLLHCDHVCIKPFGMLPQAAELISGSPDG